MKETRFKDTEIGRIPEDWEARKIEEITPLQRGFDLPVKNQEEGCYPVVYSNGICSYHNQFLCKGPGIVTGRSGTIGKVHYIDCNYWPHNTTLWATQINGCPKYLYYLLSTINWRSLATGSGVPTLNRNDVHKLILPIPSLIQEQSRIASALTSIDNLIASLDKLIEKKKNIKKGTMQQLLTGKKRLKGFTEPWVEKVLGQVGKTYSGLTGKTKDDFGVGNARYITFLNVLNNPILKPFLFENVNVNDNERQNQARKGDLFFNTSSETPEEVGICSMLEDDFDELYLNSFCFGYRLNDQSIYPKYLSYYFRSKEGRKLMTMLAQGVTRYNMSKSAFNAAKISMPASIDEQKAITDILECIDHDIESISIKNAKYVSIKQGMMQQLLTGRIRLIDKITASDYSHSS